MSFKRDFIVGINSEELVNRCSKLIESERSMSTCFENGKVADGNSSTLEASSFQSSIGITLDDESNDDTDDTPFSQSTSGSSSRPQDENNNEKQYGKVYGTNNADYTRTEVLYYKKSKFSPTEKLTINSNCDSESLPKLEDLTLDSDSESLTINKIAELSLNNDHKALAGVVTSIAKVMGLMVVKPSIPRDVLLSLGTPVFLKKSSTVLISKEVKLIGWIIDVFGPAWEPYYCIKPVNNGIELIREGTQVFYLPDHPRTGFLCLKKEDDNRYTVHYLPRDRHQQNRFDEKDFWSKDSKNDFHRRQSYRRRQGGKNRGTYTYRNKYRDDIYAFPPIHPKHSYFDF